MATKKELMAIFLKIDADHTKLITIGEDLGEKLLKLDELLNSLPDDKPAPRKPIK